MEFIFTLPTEPTGLVKGIPETNRPFNSYDFVKNLVDNNIKFKLNLMLMDYSTAQSDAGKAATDALHAVAQQLGSNEFYNDGKIHYEMLQATPMIGANDYPVGGTIFTIKDALTLEEFCRANDIEISMWSLTRDHNILTTDLRKTSLSFAPGSTPDTPAATLLQPTIPTKWDNFAFLKSSGVASICSDYVAYDLSAPYSAFPTVLISSQIADYQFSGIFGGQ